MEGPTEVTGLLLDWARGDRAALERLIPLVPDGQGMALFKIPADGGGAPVRLVDREAVNPVRSPTDNLIVYSGPLSSAQVTLYSVRPDRTPVDLKPVRVSPGAYRFLRDGTGLVFVPRYRSLDFWLFDLGSGETRQLTHLENQGILRTFDLTPDGTHIVFDRSRENADIVLIDRPK